MNAVFGSLVMAAATLLAAASIAFGEPVKAEIEVMTSSGTSLPVVISVDLQRYSGVWFEQARLPNRFQSACVSRVTAEYKVQPDETLSVINRCVTAEGQSMEALGVGRHVPAQGAPEGQLEVRFAPRWLSWLSGVWGDYWVLGLDPDYRIALVGTPDREYLWLLSRDQSLSPQATREWLAKAAALGFAVENVVLTPQEDNTVASHP